MSKMMRQFEGMNFLKLYYTNSELSDTQFAAHMSEELGEPYTLAQVRAMRLALGIPKNGEQAKKLPEDVVEFLRFTGSTDEKVALRAAELLTKYTKENNNAE